MNKKTLFEKLYNRIQQCSFCPGVNSDKVVRIIEKTNLDAKIMLIAEAMAANQVRVSGVNYFDKEGKIGNTGKMLEKFLGQFGYSVYPSHANCIYNSEIVHCFPGYIIKNDKKSIRRPSKEEIKTCIGKNFLIDEINMLHPKIIFLMGQTSYESFYSNFLHIDKKKIIPLSKKIDLIKETNTYEIYNGIPIIPIQHASGANPRFFQMGKDLEFITIIQDILDNIIV